MSGDWKPGDVAMVGGKWAPLKVRVFGFDMVGDGRWSEGHGGFVRAEDATEVRPLVVIDPEDAEQVEKLRKSMVDSGAFTGLTKGNLAKIAAALREFADPTPPKPAEPQGLGAVVEDAEGRRFVRLAPEIGSPYPNRVWAANAYVATIRYDDISAVRVLSDGVTTVLGGE